MLADYNNLIFEQENGIGLLTINRPKALNALNYAVLQELNSALDEIASDSSIKVVVLTGGGEKAFVAGADISEMQNMSALEGRNFGKFGQGVFDKLEKLPQPVIAAINGFALGGGCELAMACDIRIASPKAKFGQPEVTLGIIPGFGGTQRLSRLIGKGRAQELLYTGDMIDAEEAYRIGLVNKVVPPAELLNAAKELAEKIVSRPQAAVQLCKHTVNTGLETNLQAAIALEAESFAVCFATADQKEGMKAFIEKRKPQFCGK